MERVGNGACRECRDGLEHCHGTVVLHASSAAECTDECGAPDALHAFRIDCEAIGCACAAAAPSWLAS